MGVVKEASLFSLRPDLVVVMHEGCVLFVVEVKNPISLDSTTVSEGVFQSETAGGQTLDYLYGLKQQGLDHPFALLSTYNESVIVRFNADHERYGIALSNAACNAKEEPKRRHIQLSGKRPPFKSSECPDTKEAVIPRPPRTLSLVLLSLSEQNDLKGERLEDDDMAIEGNEDIKWEMGITMNPCRLMTTEDVPCVIRRCFK